MFASRNKMLRSIVYTLFLVIWLIVLIDGHFKNLAWNGGPMHVQCEHGLDLWTKTGQYTKENVIATKAFAFQDDVYVITPRYVYKTDNIIIMQHEL